nr:MAG TPA: hypothetical protein [Caudoviricetes sp.]
MLYWCQAKLIAFKATVSQRREGDITPHGVVSLRALFLSAGGAT